MITKEINSVAELWFTQMVIASSKTESGVQGHISAHGSFIVPDGTEIEKVYMTSDINEFLVGLATKLDLNPLVVYQGICESLEDLYNKQTTAV